MIFARLRVFFAEVRIVFARLRVDRLATLWYNIATKEGLCQ